MLSTISEYTDTFQTFHIQIETQEEFKIKHDILTTDWKCKKYDVPYESILARFERIKKSDRIPDSMSCVAGIPKHLSAALFR